ncbi:MAG TPA: hypothetical protein DD670_18440 [Planctomycetaceae bacterium]|nr:hypothetical protein [Planctomycetaceae bacterium]
MKTYSLPMLLVILLAIPAATFAGGTDLADLATVVDRTSHRASSFDRTGGNDDNLMSFEPGQTAVLLDTKGPGVITHIWFTVSAFRGGPDTVLRDLVLRIYWEGSKTPSVEAPLGDFFGLGHGRVYPVQSLPINVGADPRALNCYWPMPFYKHARIELTNEGKQSVRRIYFNISYELGKIQPNQGLFHAEYRSVRDLKPQVLVRNTHGEDNYVLLDTEGEGQYVGCFLFVDAAPGGWWGEGDEMIFVDGESKPSIVGTGTEDYFCEAWGFDRVTGFPYYGIPLLDKLPNGRTQTTCYRFHVPDPVRFKKAIRVTIEHGWAKDVTNDYSSVAFWYQTEPVATRPTLPKGEDARPRNHAAEEPKRLTSVRWPAMQAETPLRALGIGARAITTGYGQTQFGGYLRLDAPNQEIALPLPLFAPGTYQVQVKLVALGSAAPVTLALDGNPQSIVERVESKGTVVTLGTAEVADDGRLKLTVRSAEPLAIDFVLVKPKQ